MTKKLYINDVVTWSSSGGGTSLQKTGSIVAIVPAGTVPDPKYGINVRPTVKGRNHESYVIKVRNDKHYWPIVSKLTVLQGSVGTPVTPSQPKVIPTTPVVKPNVSILQTYNQAEPVAQKLKNYVGFSLDFSGSMQHITEAARNDYNNNLTAIRNAAINANQETVVSTVRCSTYYTGSTAFLTTLTNIQALTPMSYGQYTTHGGTPLFKRVNTLIDHFLGQPDANDPNVSFLLLITTDGEDTEGGGSALGKRIQQLQAQGNWTITFRVPRGGRSVLVRHGIPDGNIMEWDQTERGVAKATASTVAAVDQYYSNRVSGVRGSNSFFANVTLTDEQIRANFRDITPDVLVYPVYTDSVIQEFVENQGVNYIRGNAYYQLTKPEDFQNYKEILVQDTVDGKIYGGDDARQLLNLPSHGTIRLRPGQTGKFTVFVQSTSVNRKLIAGTRLIYKR